MLRSKTDQKKQRRSTDGQETIRVEDNEQFLICANARLQSLARMFSWVHFSLFFVQACLTTLAAVLHTDIVASSLGDNSEGQMAGLITGSVASLLIGLHHVCTFGEAAQSCKTSANLITQHLLVRDAIQKSEVNLLLQTRTLCWISPFADSNCPMGHELEGKQSTSTGRV